MADSEENQENDIDTPADLIERWGGSPAAFAEGFVGAPTILLTHMTAIGDGNDGISTTEIIFIMQVMSFKWGEEPPFPSYRRIARRMGISERYSRRVARNLEEKGLLRREQRNDKTNKFHLDPLFKEISRIGLNIESENPLLDNKKDE
jgi:hypothetical protein